MTFHYDFHQIREILIFCIGNPIVNLMNFEDFEEFSSFFQEKILYREFNSKFPNSMSNWKIFGKIKISHRIFYGKSLVFFLWSRWIIMLKENHTVYCQTHTPRIGARKTRKFNIILVYCIAVSHLGWREARGRRISGRRTCAC